MRVLKTKWFGHFARKESLSEVDITKALRVRELQEVAYDDETIPEGGVGSPA